MNMTCPRCGRSMSNGERCDCGAGFIDAEQVSRGQKILIGAFAVQLLGPAFGAQAPGLALLLLPVAVILLVLGVVEIGRGLRWSGAAIALTLLFMLVPLGNLITLLVVNSRATAALRRSGYHVGFFGATR